MKQRTHLIHLNAIKRIKGTIRFGIALSFGSYNFLPSHNAEMKGSKVWLVFSPYFLPLYLTFRLWSEILFGLLGSIFSLRSEKHKHGRGLSAVESHCWSAWEWKENRLGMEKVKEEGEKRNWKRRKSLNHFKKSQVFKNLSLSISTKIWSA